MTDQDNRDALLALAERCEAATGADPELDYAIGGAMHQRGWHAADCLGQFTGSLDAAVRLVPEGLSFEIRRSGTGDKGQATIWDPMRMVGAVEWRVTGCANPALALTAASLRARAAMMGEGSAT